MKMKRLLFFSFVLFPLTLVNFQINIFLFRVTSYNIMNDNDIEGEEDGISGMDGEVKVSCSRFSVVN